MKKKTIIYGAIGAAALVLLIIVIVVIAGKNKHQTRKVKEGREYIEALEQQDIAPVENIIKENRQKDIAAMREERLNKLLSGEIDVWPLFQDYAILGDSRAVGFWFFDYLPQERVLAEGGDTIYELGHHVEDLKALNPTYIWICYGLNDVSIGYWPTPEEYVVEYLDNLRMVQEALPDAKLIVCSILPARDPAFDLEPSWERIPEYSAALKQMCEDYGYYYCDNSKIAEEYAVLWDPDGIHVKREFYPYWAANLLEAAYEIAE